MVKAKQARPSRPAKHIARPLLDAPRHEPIPTLDACERQLAGEIERLREEVIAFGILANELTGTPSRLCVIDGQPQPTSRLDALARRVKALSDQISGLAFERKRLSKAVQG